MEKPIEYEQTDARWKNIMYSSHNDKTQTIGASGCGPTCAAMVIATLRDAKITPKDTCAWSIKKGFRSYNSGTAWAYFAAQMKEYGIEIEQTGDVNKALSALKNGLMVITSASKGIWTSSGHFILAYGLSDDGQTVYINDPNSEQSYRELAKVSYYKQQTSQFWIIKEAWQMKEEDIRRIVREELQGSGNTPSAWAKGDWEEAKKEGVTDGTKPQGYTTREQVITMIKRVLKSK